MTGANAFLVSLLGIGLGVAVVVVAVTIEKIWEMHAWMKQDRAKATGK